MGKIKCPKCVYKSDSWSVKRHLERKHKEHLTTTNGTYQTHRNYASHSYVNPYINNGTKHDNTYSHQTTWTDAYNMGYGMEARAPTIKYVGPNESQLLQHEYASEERTRTRTTSEVDTMETDEHPQDFLLESDSEESDIDVAHELEDIITDIDISFTNIVTIESHFNVERLRN